MRYRNKQEIANGNCYIIANRYIVDYGWCRRMVL